MWVMAQKWEYTWKRTDEIEEIDDFIDKKGLQGWELVNVTDVGFSTIDEDEAHIFHAYTAFMKRPLP